MVATNFTTTPDTGLYNETTSTTANVALGTLFMGTNGSMWMYVLAGAAVRQYAFATVDQAYSLIEATKANVLLGYRVAFPQIAFASGDYGWVALSGVNIKSLGLASILPNIAIYTSGTAGNLGTTATGHTKISGLTITATAGTATTGNTVNCLATWPHAAI